MPDWLVYLVIALVAAFVLAILGLVLLLFLLKPKGVSLFAGIKLIPDVIRLIARLSKEQGIGRTIRIALVVVFLYLVSPIDVIPDFLPVVGQVDDVILFVAVLRGVLRRTSPELLEAKWPGGRESFAVLMKFFRLPRAGQ